MKPETTIQIGHIKIWENNGDIFVSPCDTVYDNEFNALFSGGTVDRGLIPRNKSFLVKDEEGAFHEFKGMEYVGIAPSRFRAKHELEAVVKYIDESLLVWNKDDFLLIKNSQLVWHGGKYAFSVIGKIVHLLPTIKFGFFELYRIGAKRDLCISELNENDWEVIKSLYSRIFEEDDD